MLPVPAQAKLVFIFSCYFGLVLFNVAAYFGVANTVLQSFAAPAVYRHFLAWRQLRSALAFAVLVASALFFLGGAFGVPFGPGEALLAVVFLASQQLADFVRRCGYVFSMPKDAARVSLFTYGLRTLLLVGLRPDTLGEFLALLTVPAVVVACWAAPQAGWFRLARRARPVEADQHWRLSMWLVADAPLKWIGVHAPIILVGLMHSVQAAAALGTVRAAISFANVLLEQLETLVPRMFAARSSAGVEPLRAAVVRLLVLGASAWSLGLLGLWLLAPWLALLFDPFYRSYYELGYVLWCANGVFFVAKVLALESRVRRDTTTELAGSVGGVLALVVSLALLPRYDAWGGAVSLLFVQFGVLAGVVLRKRFLVAEGRTC